MGLSTSSGSRGCTRKLSWVAKSKSKVGRNSRGAYISAERVTLTEEITRSAICSARGPVSMEKKVCSQMPKLIPISPSSRKKVRLKSPILKGGFLGLVMLLFLVAAIGDKYIAKTPYCLYKHRLGRIRLYEFAQTGNLYV